MGIVIPVAINRPIAIVAFFLSVFLGAANAAEAAPPIPQLKERVTDQAGMLSESSRRQLEANLASYERQTGHQFALLTIESLDGHPIEDYSIKVVEAWKLGDKKRDDGLLLLIAKNDRKMRIEVGYGLEGALPDAIAAQVIRHQIEPAFRAGQFEQGIFSAFDVLMKRAAGEAVRVGPDREAHPEEGSGGISLLALLFGLGLLALGIFRPSLLGSIALGMLLGGSGRRGGMGGGGFGGRGFGGGGGGFGGGGASGGW
jgi:uncharacterized protein